MKGFQENHMETISENISELASAIHSLASQPQVVNVQAASPVVVPPSQVDFSPAISVPEPPKKWVFEVVERDSIGRIRKLSATAL